MMIMLSQNVVLSWSLIRLTSISFHSPLEMRYEPQRDSGIERFRDEVKRLSSIDLRGFR